MRSVQVPLFPLQTVVCPQGRIPLQIFEPRYMDMLSRCLKEGQGFVISLIKTGKDTGACEFYDIGTYVRIVDFERLSNGLLGITAAGEAKVAILSQQRQADGLYVGEVAWLEPEAEELIPAEYSDLVVLLRELMRHPVVSSLGLQPDLDSANEVGWRLTELLPLELRDKQYLLSINEPLKRLQQLQRLVLQLEDN